MSCTSGNWRSLIVVFQVLWQVTLVVVACVICFIKFSTECETTRCMVRCLVAPCCLVTVAPCCSLCLLTGTAFSTLLSLSQSDSQSCSALGLLVLYRGLTFSLPCNKILPLPPPTNKSSVNKSSCSSKMLQILLSLHFLHHFLFLRVLFTALLSNLCLSEPLVATLNAHSAHTHTRINV